MGEESAALSLRHVHFAHRRCRWVIIPLDHYCMMTKLLSPKRTMAKGCLKNDVQIDKKIICERCFPFLPECKTNDEEMG